jgi:transposase-like protein
MFTSRLSQAAALFALAFLAGACGKKADSSDDDNAPEVSAAGVPDVASGSDDAETRELARYQLTMDKVRKMSVAAEKLKQLEREHPELAKQRDTASSKEMELSIDEIEARVERMPAARKAIEDAGLTVREYAVATLVFLQAMVGQMMIQQGQSPDSVARELGMNPANLRFVKEHEAELAKTKNVLQ